MAVIPGAPGNHFHDAHGNHVRPVGNGRRPVQQAKIDVYADHIIAHQRRGEPTEEDD